MHEAITGMNREFLTNVTVKIISFRLRIRLWIRLSRFLGNLEIFKIVKNLSNISSTKFRRQTFYRQRG